jgi:hypothetical protein
MSRSNLPDKLRYADLPSSGKALCIGGTNALIAWGTTVPSDGVAGYAVGCLFIHTDGSAGSALYCNEGTAASCDFDAVTVA